MKYFYEKPKVWEKRGTTYYCDFPYYNACTLFLKEGKGLAVVQKRFNKKAKCASFGPLDPWLAYDIYENDRFWSYFDEYAGDKDEYGAYPTVTARQIMWALRIKPLKAEQWENFF